MWIRTIHVFDSDLISKFAGTWITQFGEVFWVSGVIVGHIAGSATGVYIVGNMGDETGGGRRLSQSVDLLRVRF